MTIEEIQSIVGPINRGKLADGFTDELKRTITDVSVPYKVVPPPITEDLSRFEGNPQKARQISDYWRGMSKAKRERESRRNRKNARAQV